MATYPAAQIPCPRCGVEKIHHYPIADPPEAEWEAYKRLAAHFICDECHAKIPSVTEWSV